MLEPVALDVWFQQRQHLVRNFQKPDELLQRAGRLAPQQQHRTVRPSTGCPAHASRKAATPASMSTSSGVTVTQGELQHQDTSTSPCDKPRTRTPLRGASRSRPAGPAAYRGGDHRCHPTAVVLLVSHRHHQGPAVRLLLTYAGPMTASASLRSCCPLPRTATTDRSGAGSSAPEVERSSSARTCSAEVAARPARAARSSSDPTRTPRARRRRQAPPRRPDAMTVPFTGSATGWTARRPGPRQTPVSVRSAGGRFARRSPPNAVLPAPTSAPPRRPRPAPRAATVER